MADHYTVLARRFRPQTFDDVVGQEHVGRAIQNAIKADRVAHAYLFTGARGVGKTSTARIFAKALNCPDVQDGVPCNSCDICAAIGDGTDVDVLEIDGASNRGIDDIRQLRANVNIRSMRSPFKVYIIDEVHMLTKEAFNALLKTLEEPPPNVKFIFCTTEPQKVPDTILSRCQRFDFGTIATDRIGLRLQEIAKTEGISVDEEAVAMVARRAGGSMRDSQSLFDQLLAFGGDHVTTNDVHRLFGTAPDERIVELLDTITKQERAAALAILDDSLSAGVRLESLADQLVAYLRDLLVLAAGGSSLPLTAVSDRFRETLAEQAEQLGLRTVTAAMQIVADTKLKMARTVHGRPLLELAIVRLTMLEDLDSLSALVAAARAGNLSAEGLGSVKKKLSSDLKSSPRPEAPEAGSTLANGDDQRPAPLVSSVSSPPAQTAIRDSQPAADPKRVESPSGPPTIDLSPETFDTFWERLLKLAPEKLSNALAESKSARLADDGSIAVEVKTEFAAQFLRSAPTKKRLDMLTDGIVGTATPFQFCVTASVSSAPATIRDRQVEPSMRKKSAVDDDPFVQSALELFGGQLVQVKTAPPIVVDTAEPANEALAEDTALMIDDEESEDA